MMRTWQLQDAKNKFSEVVAEAVSKGPQLITKHGTEAVIVVSYAEYQRLIASQQSLSEFFRQSPLAGVELDLSRDHSPVRDDVPL
jgi:antitoxin Phd